MSHLLVINSSAAGRDSVSRVLVADAVGKLLEADPGVHVTHRDLGENPPPHLISQTLNGVRGTATTDIEFAARRLSDELIGELKAADTVVIGAPMYNFSVPTTLRAWFDHVLRAGVTFKYVTVSGSSTLVNQRTRRSASSSSSHAAACTAKDRRRPSTSRSRTSGTCSASSASPMSHSCAPKRSAMGRKPVPRRSRVRMRRSRKSWTQSSPRPRSLRRP